MLEESIIKSLKNKSAEARDFGTALDLNVSPKVLFKDIITQKFSNFTDFLSYECVTCTVTLNQKNAIRIEEGWACQDCYQSTIKATEDFLKAAVRQNRKVIRLYKCCGCSGNFTLRKMSNILPVCRGCLLYLHESNKEVRAQFIKRFIKKLDKVLGGRK